MASKSQNSEALPDDICNRSNSGSATPFHVPPPNCPSWHSLGLTTALTSLPLSVTGSSTPKQHSTTFGQNNSTDAAPCAPPTPLGKAASSCFTAATTTTTDDRSSLTSAAPVMLGTGTTLMQLPLALPMLQPRTCKPSTSESAVLYSTGYSDRQSRSALDQTVPPSAAATVPMATRRSSAGVGGGSSEREWRRSGEFRSLDKRSSHYSTQASYSSNTSCTSLLEGRGRRGYCPRRPTTSDGHARCVEGSISRSRDFEGDSEDNNSLSAPTIPLVTKRTGIPSRYAQQQEESQHEQQISSLDEGEGEDHTAKHVSYSFFKAASGELPRALLFENNLPVDDDITLAASSPTSTLREAAEQHEQPSPDKNVLNVPQQQHHVRHAAVLAQPLWSTLFTPQLGSRVVLGSTQCRDEYFWMDQLGMEAFLLVRDVVVPSGLAGTVVRESEEGNAMVVQFDIPEETYLQVMSSSGGGGSSNGNYGGNECVFVPSPSSPFSACSTSPTSPPEKSLTAQLLASREVTASAAAAARVDMAKANGGVGGKTSSSVHDNRDDSVSTEDKAMLGTAIFTSVNDPVVHHQEGSIHSSTSSIGSENSFPLRFAVPQGSSLTTISSPFRNAGMRRSSNVIAHENLLVRGGEGLLGVNGGGASPLRLESSGSALSSAAATAASVTTALTMSRSGFSVRSQPIRQGPNSHRPSTGIASNNAFSSAHGGAGDAASLTSVLSFGTSVPVISGLITSQVSGSTIIPDGSGLHEPHLLPHIAPISDGLIETSTLRNASTATTTMAISTLNHTTANAYLASSFALLLPQMLVNNSTSTVQPLLTGATESGTHKKTGGAGDSGHENPLQSNNPRHRRQSLPGTGMERSLSVSGNSCSSNIMQNDNMLWPLASSSQVSAVTSTTIAATNTPAACSALSGTCCRPSPPPLPPLFSPPNTPSSVGVTTAIITSSCGNNVDEQQQQQQQSPREVDGLCPFASTNVLLQALCDADQAKKLQNDVNMDETAVHHNTCRVSVTVPIKCCVSSVQSTLEKHHAWVPLLEALSHAVNSGGSISQQCRNVNASISSVCASRSDHAAAATAAGSASSSSSSFVVAATTAIAVVSEAIQKEWQAIAKVGGGVSLSSCAWPQAAAAAAVAAAAPTARAELAGLLALRSRLHFYFGDAYKCRCDAACCIHLAPSCAEGYISYILGLMAAASSVPAESPVTGGESTGNEIEEAAAMAAETRARCARLPDSFVRLSRLVQVIRAYQHWRSRAQQHQQLPALVSHQPLPNMLSSSAALADPLGGSATLDASRTGGGADEGEEYHVEVLPFVPSRVFCNAYPSGGGGDHVTPMQRLANRRRRALEQSLTPSPLAAFLLGDGGVVTSPMAAASSFHTIVPTSATFSQTAKSSTSPRDALQARWSRLYRCSSATHGANGGGSTATTSSSPPSAAIKRGKSSGGATASSSYSGGVAAAGSLRVNKAVAARVKVAGNLGALSTSYYNRLLRLYATRRTASGGVLFCERASVVLPLLPASATRAVEEEQGSVSSKDVVVEASMTSLESRHLGNAVGGGSASGPQQLCLFCCKPVPHVAAELLRRRSSHGFPHGGATVMGASKCGGGSAVASRCMGCGATFCSEVCHHRAVLEFHSVECAALQSLPQVPNKEAERGPCDEALARIREAYRAYYALVAQVSAWGKPDDPKVSDADDGGEDSDDEWEEEGEVLLAKGSRLPQTPLFGRRVAEEKELPVSRRRAGGERKDSKTWKSSFSSSTNASTNFWQALRQKKSSTRDTATLLTVTTLRLLAHIIARVLSLCLPLPISSALSLSTGFGSAGDTDVTAAARHLGRRHASVVASLQRKLAIAAPSASAKMHSDPQGLLMAEEILQQLDIPFFADLNHSAPARVWEVTGEVPPPPPPLRKRRAAPGYRGGVAAHQHRTTGKGGILPSDWCPAIAAVESEGLGVKQRHEIAVGVRNFFNALSAAIEECLWDVPLVERPRTPSSDMRPQQNPENAGDSRTAAVPQSPRCLRPVSASSSSTILTNFRGTLSMTPAQTSVGGDITRWSCSQVLCFLHSARFIEQLWDFCGSSFAVLEVRHTPLDAVGTSSSHHRRRSSSLTSQLRFSATAQVSPVVVISPLLSAITDLRDGSVSAMNSVDVGASNNSISMLHHRKHPRRGEAIQHSRFFLEHLEAEYRRTQVVATRERAKEDSFLSVNSVASVSMNRSDISVLAAAAAARNNGGGNLTEVSGGMAVASHERTPSQSLLASRELLYLAGAHGSGNGGCSSARSHKVGFGGNGGDDVVVVEDIASNNNGIHSNVAVLVDTEPDHDGDNAGVSKGNRGRWVPGATSEAGLWLTAVASRDVAAGEVMCFENAATSAWRYFEARDQ